MSLPSAGFDAAQPGAAQHVWFEGLDRDGAGEPYGTSIPLAKGASPSFFFDSCARAGGTM